MNAIVDLTPADRQDMQTTEAPARPLTAVEHAIRSGATPEQLERVLELMVRADNHQLELMREKRRMDEEDRKRAAELAFRRDFAVFRGKNIVVPRSKYVDRGKAGGFNQAEYHMVAGMISPALSECGFSFRHDQRFGTKDFPADGSNPNIPAGTMLAEPWVYVTCFLEHRDGHTERLDLDGPPGDATANGAIQNMQVAASMLKRLSLLAITGTPTGGEDDERKMGRKGAIEPTGEEADARAELVQAGNDEAMKGMVALTAWWGKLTAKQRGDLNAEFGAMRKCAGIADSKGAAK